jgi:RNA-directed DNA polymerase
MHSFDKYWSDYVQAKEICYSRYADDVTFSISRRYLLYQTMADFRAYIKTMQCPTLRLNEKKTVFTSRKHCRRVTTLTSGSKISLGRDKKREIKALVCRASQGRLEPDRLTYLRGYLSFARNVEPTFLANMRTKYGPDVIEGIIRN